ncbi:MAG TPA: PAS domain S-box protein, partial [Nitrospirae bacterium]|nr:PAS domain S-box protein [Nitrospirota bacterium]
MNLTIRHKMILGIGVFTLFLLGASYFGYMGIRDVNIAAQDMMHESMGIEGINRLNNAVQKLIMPANDYLISGDKIEYEHFEAVLNDTRLRFAMLENIIGSEEERIHLSRFEQGISRVEILTRQIFALEKPVGSLEGADLMEELAAAAYLAIDEIGMVMDEAKIKHDAFVEKTALIRDNYANLMILLTLGLIISGITIAQLMTYRTIDDIGQLVKVSERISNGDLNQTVKTRSSGEINQLANSFNKMVEGLRSSHNDLLAEKAYSDSIISNMIDSLIVVDKEGLIKTVNKATLDLLGFTEKELVGQPVANIFEEEEILNELEESAILISRDFKIIKANDVFLKSTGLKRKEVINMPCYKVTHGRDSICEAPHDICPIKEDMSSREPCVEVHKHFDSDGNSHLVRVIAAPIRGQKGDIEYYLYLSKNVDSEKGQLSEDHLHKIRVLIEKLEAIAGKLEDEKIFTEGAVEKLMTLGTVRDLGMFYRTRWGGIVPVMFSGSLIRDKVGNVAGVIGVARDMRQMNKYIEDEKKLAVATVEAKEGLIRALELEEAYHKLETSKDAALNIMEDMDEQATKLKKEVSERREAEDKLTKAYKEVELLANLVENAHEMVFVMSPEGHILKSNSSSRNVFGYSGIDILNLRIGDIFRITKSNLEKLIYEIRGKSFWQGELTAVCNDGREFPAVVTVSRPGKPSVYGNNEDVICFVRDVTEEKEIDRMKNEFISTVSHELRTPLSITKEGISLVLDRIPGKINKQQEELLGTALNNIDRLARIINELLDISKIEARKIELRREGVDIISVINQVTSAFEQKLKSQGLELRTAFPDNSLQVYMDKDKTIQIFTNIISNSLKFTEKGFIEISVKEDNDKVECVISDSGKGVSKDDMPKLFSKFQQFGRTAGPGEKGTGLGLSIVKNLVEMQGGVIEVRSDLDKGMETTIILPKYTFNNILKENVQEGISNAGQTGESYTLLLIEMSNFYDLEKKVEKHETDKVFRSLLDEVKKLLRRNCDILVEDHSYIFVLLPQTSKENALIILD